jgi:hypothetical protein
MNNISTKDIKRSSLKNIPTSISILHDIEYKNILSYSLNKSKKDKRRSMSEKRSMTEKRSK